MSDRIILCEIHELPSDVNKYPSYYVLEPRYANVFTVDPAANFNPKLAEPGNVAKVIGYIQNIAGVLGFSDK